MLNPKLSKEDVNNLINEMLKNSEFPSKIVLGVKSYEESHTKLIIEKFSRYIGCFEHGFDLLVNLVLVVNYLDKKLWRLPHKTIQILLLKNSLYPLYSAFDRLLKGFYTDSTILLRVTYESFIRMLYISYYPDNPYISVIHKSQKGQRKFNLTDFLKNTLKVDWNFIYDISSSFSHSYKYQTLTEAIDIHQYGQKGLICFKLEYDEEKASLSMNFSMFLIWCLVKFSRLLFINPKDEKLEPNFYAKLITTENALGAMIMSATNKWAITLDDVERIANKIKAKEGIVL
jgi:hypothetical protein